MCALTPPRLRTSAPAGSTKHFAGPFFLGSGLL